MPEPHPNCILLVRLDNENLILGYVSGRIWHNFFIHIVSVDRVKIEESNYDSTEDV
uniref:Translation initiation factor IF-1 n=1 Tax=Gironniera nervosa TaxID=1827312 RepID=UPI002A83950D|nr:Translation initiation factor IF-1 [Gironniera nervosa]WOE90743.1 Translation initiation factor IF-1 [Gironniera nervosa]